MIYTVTFNPALDYVVKVNHFTLGMVNRTVQEDIYYGGKGINVSAVLKTLGFQSLNQKRNRRSTGWDRRLPKGMWKSCLSGLRS